MLNVTAIMGRLSRDPELRQTTTGKNVASFTIACSRGRKDANGKDLVDWIPVVAWEHTAEFVCKYFEKGSLIAIDGRLQSRSYQDRDGNNRTAIEIVANNVNFAGSKSTGGGSNSVPAGGSRNEPTVQYDEIEDEGDLPF
uniref:single-stranded DNA-binding protein n=1 Tax=Gemmiger formicilis TaxID=745368 RepID=UPI004026453E